MENKDKENRPGIIPGVNQVNSLIGKPEKTDIENKNTEDQVRENNTSRSSEIINNTGDDIGTPKGDADAASG